MTSRISRNELEDKAEALHKEIQAALPRATIVTIVSINDERSGQWIIGDRRQDPREVARRLRICGALLHGKVLL